MSLSSLPPRSFDRLVSLSEQATHEQHQRSNDAFAAAMTREIRKGKLKVKPGTHVDTSPHYTMRVF